VDVGSGSFVCSGSSVNSPSPCAQAFLTYNSIDDIVQSELYSQCVSVANANCLGYTSHEWCSAGGTSLASTSVVSFLQNLQSACSFPYRAVTGTFVFTAGSVSSSTVSALLLGDLQALTSSTPAQGLFDAYNVTVDGTTVTVLVTIFSGVPNQDPDTVAALLTALQSDPTTAFYTGNVTKFIASMSFVDNYPFVVTTTNTFTDGQIAGIVAGVLIFVVLTLVVYQLYAYYSKKAGEESDSDEDQDEEDSAVIHQRNQARYAEANKQEPQQQAQSQPQAQPVQSQDEAIVSWS